jgi:hypothetical protein
MEHWIRRESIREVLKDRRTLKVEVGDDKDKFYLWKHFSLISLMRHKESANA